MFEAEPRLPPWWSANCDALRPLAFQVSRSSDPLTSVAGRCTLHELRIRDAETGSTWHIIYRADADEMWSLAPNELRRLEMSAGLRTAVTS
jgi:hypothetical protein